MANRVDLELAPRASDERPWHHSEFPHPLITVDYREDGTPFAVSALGSMSFLVADAYVKGGRPEEIVARIAEYVKERT